MAHPRSTQDPAGAFGGLGRAKATLADGVSSSSAESESYHLRQRPRSRRRAEPAVPALWAAAGDGGVRRAAMAGCNPAGPGSDGFANPQTLKDCDALLETPQGADFALFGHLLAKDCAANAVALPLKLVLESFDKDIQIAAHP